MIRNRIIKYAVFLTFFIAGTSFAQNSIDSVIASINTLSDTTKIRVLAELCFQYRLTDETFALKCGEYALDLANQARNEKLRGKTLNYLGVLYRDFSNYEKAHTTFISALKAAESSNDSIEIGYAENNISHAARMKKYYPVALRHAFKSYEVFSTIKNKTGLGFAAITIGDIYISLKKYDLAQAYLDTSYQIRLEQKDIQGLIFVQATQAKLFTDIKQYSKAFALLFSAIKKYDELKFKGGLISGYESLGKLYFLTNQLDSSYYYYEKAFDLAVKLNSISGQISVSRSFAMILAATNKAAEGEKILLNALSLAKTRNDDYLLTGLYLTLSSFYEKTNNIRMAFHYSELALSLKSKLNSNESFAISDEMESLYLSEKSWKENNKLISSIESTKTARNWGIGILIILLIFLIAIAYKMLQSRRIAHELHTLNATKDRFFSIIAHDLKNPFNGLMGISQSLLYDIQNKNYDKIERYISLLHDSSKRGYQLLLNLLEWSFLQTGRIKIANEDINLRSLVDESINPLFTASTSKGIEIVNQIPEDLVIHSDSNLLKTIFRNLLSNAIKYSFTLGKVEVYCTKNNKTIEMTVKDYGIGIEKEDLPNLFKIDRGFTTPGTSKEKGTGLGLILCRDFIQLLGGTITAKSVPTSGTSFSFILPLNGETNR